MSDVVYGLVCLNGLWYRNWKGVFVVSFVFIIDCVLIRLFRCMYCFLFLRNIKYLFEDVLNLNMWFFVIIIKKVNWFLDFYKYLIFVIDVKCLRIRFNFSIEGC